MTCPLPTKDRHTCAAWDQRRADKGLPGCGMEYIGHRCPNKPQGEKGKSYECV